VGPNPFVGTWSGIQLTATNQEVRYTLTMTGNTWTMSWPAVPGVIAGNLSGTFARDTDTGRTVEFTRTEGPIGRDPRSGEILSPRELRVTIGSGRSEVTFTR